MSALMCILICIAGFGQLKNLEPVTVAMLTQKDYFAKDAEAIVLSDQGVTRFLPAQNFDIRFVRTKRIKILKQEGTRFANVAVAFYTDGFGKTERIENVKGFAYNFENNEIVRTSLEKSNIYREKINANWVRIKFALPKVKVGTIIEFEYTLITPFIFNLPDWDFQSDIPTIKSDYQVGMIPYFSYMYTAQGMRSFDRFNKKEQRYTDRFDAAGYGSAGRKEIIYSFGKQHSSIPRRIIHYLQG